MGKGKCFVVSAPSGAGKTTLEGKLLKGAPGFFYQSISDTTRGIRGKEVDGVDYNFIGEDEFNRRIKGGHYLEWANVHECFYGTPKMSLLDAVDKGKNVLMVIDVQGYSQVQSRISDEILCGIFVLPPSLEELARRLGKRGDTKEREMASRLSKAKEEMSHIGEFKHYLVNDDLKETYEKLKRIIEVETGLYGRVFND